MELMDAIYGRRAGKIAMRLYNWGEGESFLI